MRKKRKEHYCEDCLSLSNADIAERLMRIQLVLNTEVRDKFTNIQTQLSDVYGRLEQIEKYIYDDD